MNNLQIEILLGIIAFCLNSFLGIVIILKDHKSWTNRLFFNLSMIINIYIVVNFLSLHPPTHTPESQLFWIRVVMFITSFIGPQLILLVHTFPNDSIRMQKKYWIPLLFSALTAASASLLPYVFTGIEYPKGQPVPIPGPGMPIFFLNFVGLFVLSFIILIYRYKKALNEEKAKIKYLLLGVLASFSLMGISTVTLVVILKTSAFVFLGPIFPVILMAFIAYAIVKHGLFNLTVVATEALTAILWIILFAKMTISRSTSERIIDISVFVGAVTFGLLLIRNVRNQIKQKIKLENLSTELESANEKLTALDEARAEFISIASHQLRTPPATVKWYLSALLSGDYGKIPKNIKEILVKMQLTTNLLISLIEDILNVSRIERGTMEFLFEEADVVNLAEITFEQLKPFATQKKLKITLKKPIKHIPKISVDKEKLRQVMNNLIDNAIKYTSAGNIQISINATDRDFLFFVKDTGKGIDKNYLQKIFEKYSRGKDSIHQSAGLGLGLYVAKIVIEQHKGKIWAESEGIDKGSVFGFSIPLMALVNQTSNIDLTNSYKKP